MRFLLATTRKDLLRIARDWPALLLWIGIPLLVGALMFVMFGGDDGAGPEGTLLIADEDGSIAARLLSGAFSQGPLAGMFTVESVETEEGRARMEDGDASGLLVIPDGFGGALLNGEAAEVELVTNPSQTVLPGILENTLDTTLEAAEVLRRLFDQPIDRIAELQEVGGSPADSTVASISTAFNQAGGTARSWILPPLVTLETVTLGEEEPFDFGTAFFPGMLILALLFMAGGLSVDVWNEKRQGTIRRALAAPAGPRAVISGKWTAGTIALSLVAAIGMAAGILLFGLEVANPLLAWGWLVLVGMGLLAIFSTIQLFAPNETAGNVIENALVLPLAMLGGSFFPFEVMPEWMASIGKLTPNGWALVVLRRIMDGTNGADLLWSAVTIETGFLLLTWVAARRVRRFAA